MQQRQREKWLFMSNRGSGTADHLDLLAEICLLFQNTYSVPRYFPQCYSIPCSGLEVLRGVVIAMICVYRVTGNEYSRNVSSVCFFFHCRPQLEDLEDQFSNHKCPRTRPWSNMFSSLEWGLFCQTTTSKVKN